MIGCTLHGVTPRVTLEKIPLDVLCDIWEVFDHVEHLTFERVSDPQQACLVLFLADECLFTCSTLPAGVIGISYGLLSLETTASPINFLLHSISGLPPCLMHS